jgi:hypothetical protein
MAKRNDNPWQFKFTFALAIVMLFLVLGYFTQSFLEIRKVKPVSVAIERISIMSTEADTGSKADQIVETENNGK